MKLRTVVGPSLATMAILWATSGCNPLSADSAAPSDSAPVPTSERTQEQVAGTSVAPTTPTSTAQAVAEQAKTANPAPKPQPVLDADLRIKRLVLAHGVEAREPVDPAEQFSLDEAKRIYAFVEVANPEAVESEIYVTFEKAGGPSVGHVALRVGPSRRWRTWAFTRGAKQTGQWVAVVRNGQGELLAQQPFEITSSGVPADESAKSPQA